MVRIMRMPNRTGVSLAKGISTPAVKNPSARVAVGVGDGIAPIAAEIARAELDARCGLAALVFGDIEELLDAFHGRGIEALLDDIVQTHLALDQAFENAVEHGVRRERVLVLLVGTKLSGGRLVDDALGHDAALRS